MAGPDIGPVVSANFTRPADTNAYTAGDVVSNSTSAPVVITFSGLGSHGGYIVEANLIDEASQSTLGQFELWLFSSAPSAENDNAAFAPSNAEVETISTIIPFSTPYAGKTSSGNTVYMYKNMNHRYQAATLYGILVVRNGYTPISGEKFTVQLRIGS